MKYANHLPRADDVKSDMIFGASYVYEPRVPMKVQAAMQFVQFHFLPQMPGPMTSGDVPSNPRRKTDSEMMAMDAAFTVIRHYFTGEMAYAEEPMIYDLATTVAKA